MSAPVIPVHFSDPTEFAAFVKGQLSQGRAMIPLNVSVELFDEVIVRVTVGARSHDIVATVAHSALRGVNGVMNVGLAVSLRPRDHQLLAELEAHVGSLDLSGDTETALSLDLEFDDAPETTVQNQRFSLENMELPERSSDLSLESLDDFFEGNVRPEAPPDTPIQTDVLEELIESRTQQRRGTVPGIFSAGLEEPQRGSVDAMIDTVLDSLGDPSDLPLNATEASAAARYRARYPEKALRADDYYQAAVADARNGSLELARTNANLAVACDATVPAYRELLESVEEQLGIKVR